MLAEACCRELASQLQNLLECSAVSFVLGCSAVELRHPLLTRSASSQCSPISVGDSSLIDGTVLLQQKWVRALCDIAIQTGRVQSMDRAYSKLFVEESSAGTDESVEVGALAVAPLERQAGVLGFLLLINSYAESFSLANCNC